MGHPAHHCSPNAQSNCKGHWDTVEDKDKEGNRWMERKGWRLKDKKGKALRGD
jgi:hypothetical protein